MAIHLLSSQECKYEFTQLLTPHAAPRSITQHHAASRSITQHYAASRSITQHHAEARTKHAGSTQPRSNHASPQHNTTHKLTECNRLIVDHCTQAWGGGALAKSTPPHTDTTNDSYSNASLSPTCCGGMQLLSPSPLSSSVLPPLFYLFFSPSFSPSPCDSILTFLSPSLLFFYFLLFSSLFFPFLPFSSFLLFSSLLFSSLL